MVEKTLFKTWFFSHYVSLKMCQLKKPIFTMCFEKALEQNLGQILLECFFQKKPIISAFFFTITSPLSRFFSKSQFSRPEQPHGAESSATTAIAGSDFGAVENAVERKINIKTNSHVHFNF